MELMAALPGLRALRERCDVEIVTDSEYVKNGITTWIHNWKRKGWLTAAKKPVINQDLWQELDEQVNAHNTTWTWTKGHANHEDNNRCDELATRAARVASSSQRLLSAWLAWPLVQVKVVLCRLTCSSSACHRS